MHNLKPGLIPFPANPQTFFVECSTYCNILEFPQFGKYIVNIYIITLSKTTRFLNFTRISIFIQFVISTYICMYMIFDYFRNP